MRWREIWRTISETQCGDGKDELTDLGKLSEEDLRDLLEQL